MHMFSKIVPNVYKSVNQSGNKDSEEMRFLIKMNLSSHIIASLHYSEILEVFKLKKVFKFANETKIGEQQVRRNCH